MHLWISLPRRRTRCRRQADCPCTSDEPGHIPVHLVKQFRQGGRITQTVGRQIAARDIARDKVQAEMQFPPGFAFGLCLMLVFKPFTSERDLIGNVSPDPRREKVEKSGARISTPMRLGGQTFCMDPGDHWTTACADLWLENEHIRISID
jgi:hypothetical protein